MPPVDRAVKCSIRVVLVEHVIMSVPFDQTVWIIHPIPWRQEMKNRAVPIGHNFRIWVVRHGFCILSIHLDLFVLTILRAPSAIGKHEKYQGAEYGYDEAG